MGLSIGTRVGPYVVRESLGAGGMGEVYRAYDTKLNREVALKVLPHAFADEPDRLVRFRREAQVLASLNHPHIAAIYGFEEHPAALVMELVEGSTLADRIATGAIPVSDAMPIAAQISEALEAAHERGIVHRDLKPANVKVRDDGTVKVLDFGLAKALAPDLTTTGVGSRSESPTVTTPAMTEAGVILGTAAYMSPEQAKGKPLDKRTDIWSFGCVVYEMLTGRRAFGGDEVSETLASVLAREPDWTLLPSDLPPTVASYVRRCLHKDPRERIHDIADIRLALNGAFDSGATALPAPGRKPRTWQRAGVVALATACLGAAIGAGVMWALKPSPLVPVTRSRFALPSAQQFTHDSHQLVAISPDGTQMAYVANNRLFLRRLAELDARPVQGTESAPGPNTTTSPVFSPDGRSLAYHDGAFRRISVDGGQALTLCQGAPPHGISWSDDFIVFGQGSGGILRVPANGGPPEQIVKVEHNELASEPQMLPGNHAVLFTLASALMPVVQARWDTARVVAQALDSGKRTTIVEGGSHARYLPTGHIVYAVGGILFAVPFDPQRLVTTGAAVPVVEGVRRSASTIGSGSANYSVSSTGALIFVPGSASGAFGQREIVSVDRSGNSETLPLPQSAYVGVRLSPSGRQLVFDTDDGKEAGVWIYDLSGGSPPRKLTFGGKNRFPIWSADGRRVVFQSDRDGDLGLFWQLADGSGLAERLTSTEKGASHVAESFSPAGDQFSYSEVAPSGVSLWTFSMRDKKAARFGDSKSTAPFNSEFSPDGRWIAFTLRTSSTANIYLAAFPSGAQYQVSTTNGHHPVWLPGDEGLSFRVGANEQVAVRVTTSPSFSAGNPVTVVAGGLPIIELGTNRPYDVTRDGRRFLSVTPASAARSGPMGVQEIEIVLNWFELLGQHMQTK